MSNSGYAPYLYIKRIDMERSEVKNCLGKSMGMVWKRYNSFGKVFILSAFMRTNQVPFKEEVEVSHLPF